MGGVLHQWCDVFIVLGQRREGELLRNSLHPPRLGTRLEPTDEQFAGIFLEVTAAIHVPEHRHGGRNALHGLGDYVEVFRCV